MTRPDQVRDALNDVLLERAQKAKTNSTYNSETLLRLVVAYRLNNCSEASFAEALHLTEVP